MSFPISNCLIIKAANGDEPAYQRLALAMKFNRECGHWSQFPCKCQPPCGPKPTDKQMKALNDRLNVDAPRPKDGSNEGDR